MQLEKLTIEQLQEALLIVSQHLPEPEQLQLLNPALFLHPRTAVQLPPLQVWEWRALRGLLEQLQMERELSSLH